MALMFPRLARNFIRNGYFPTDEPTLERALSALAPSPGSMSILDPCAGEGVAIIMISSELPEVLGVSDRIAVMCEGTLMDILDTAEATQENIMALASGTNEK